MRTHAISKRVLSVVLALMLVLGMLPVVALAADTTTIYFDNTAGWKTVKIYYWGGAGAASWPGSSMKLVEGTIYSFDVPAGCNMVIFNNNSGTQTADLNKPNDGKNLYTYSTGEWSTYDPSAACEHVWDAGQIVTAPTCTAQGEATFTCTKCGISYNDSVAATGHNFVDGSCSVCGVGEAIVIYFQNTSGWDHVNVYYWGGASKPEWPGVAMTQVAGDIWTYTLPGDAVNIIFNNGSTQTGDLVIPADKDLFVFGGDWTNYNPEACTHDWGEGNVVSNPTCTEAGQTDYVCSLCGEEKSDEVAALGHSYYAGVCTVCGEAKPVLDFYLVGYINGADYGCQGDYENMGEYKFVDGTLTATFTADSYIYIKTEGNANWYLTQSYCTDTTATFVEGGSEKMFVPKDLVLTFTLVENDDGSLTLSYTTEAPSCLHPVHGLDGVCADCGKTVEHTFMDGVCTICGLEDMPVLVTDYFVASSVNGWVENDSNFQMALVNDLYVLSMDIPAGATKFKVTDGTWDNAWPSSDYVVNAAEDCTITITFNAETGEITVTGYTEAPAQYYLYGYINGADYNGTDYLFVDGSVTVNFSETSYVFICTDSGVQYMAEAFITEPSGVFVLGGGEKMQVPAGEITFTLVENEDDSLTLSYEAPSAGVTVSGTVTSFNSDSDEVVVELIQDGNVAYTTTVTGKTAAYAIEGVAAGNYTLKVSKNAHVALELEITVADADVAQDAKICLIGDVTGDGKVNMKDWSRLYDHIGETSVLEGYSKLCADTTGDGKVNMKDWSRLYDHISETNPLW